MTIPAKPNVGDPFEDLADFVDAVREIETTLLVLPAMQTEIDDLQTALVNEAIFNVRDYAALGDGTTNDYAAINAAVLAAGAAGGGIVYFPPGTYRLGTSITAGGFDNIHFRGAGRELTKLKPTDAGSAQCFNVTTNRCSIRDLTADGNLTARGASGLHAIRIQGIGHLIDNVRVYDSPGYGIGVGQGSGSTVQEFTISNTVIERSSADGIDFKDQSSTNRDITLHNVTVIDYDVAGGGDKAGIDCRGPVKASAISIRQVTTDTPSIGFRFRPGTLGASLTGFHIVGNTPATASKGIQLGDVGNIVANGRVENFGIAVDVGDAAGDCLVSQVVAVNCDDGSQGAFTLSATAGGTALVNCHASGCANAYFVDGHDNRIVNCSARDCTRGFWITGDDTVIRGGALIGDFTQHFRIDAGGDNTWVQGLDFRQVLTGSFTDSGAGTVMRDCPGRTGIGDVVLNDGGGDYDFRVEGDTDANLLTVDAGLDMVGIGAVPATKFDVNADSVRIRTAKTPASATATGIQGQIAWDATHLYVCIATNVWQRVAHATW